MNVINDKIEVSHKVKVQPLFASGLTAESLLVPKCLPSPLFETTYKDKTAFSTDRNLKKEAVEKDHDRKQTIRDTLANGVNSVVPRMISTLYFIFVIILIIFVITLISYIAYCFYIGDLAWGVTKF